MNARCHIVDPSRIRLLLTDGLSEAEKAELELHLETCEACSGMIERLSADTGWWEEARRFVAADLGAAAAVVHEHVVAIHAVNTWRGLPYLVMQHVPGHSLQERIDRDGPLEIEDVLRVGMQAAAGLAAAHAQGLVHRDVKPSNILLE